MPGAEYQISTASSARIHLSLIHIYLDHRAAVAIDSLLLKALRGKSGVGLTFGGSRLTRSAGLGSVSYTHLDVYKRQQRRIVPARCTDRLFR